MKWTIFKINIDIPIRWIPRGRIVVLLDLFTFKQLKNVVWQAKCDGPNDQPTQWLIGCVARDKKKKETSTAEYIRYDYFIVPHCNICWQVATTTTAAPLLIATASLFIAIGAAPLFIATTAYFFVTAPLSIMAAPLFIAVALFFLSDNHRGNDDISRRWRE